MKMKGLFVAVSSFALTAGVIANAFWQKKQFYPSVVYITKSSPSLAILYLQAFVMVALMWKIIRKIFFGQLRAAETEHLIERSWYAITETCLAFTVFRDDFSPRFVALFTMLLFIKAFHWLTDDRVDYMERSPLISLMFHLRVLSIISVLGLIDAYFIHHAIFMTHLKGASVQLVFGFEYAILLTMILQTWIKYILHTIDLQTENPWEKKAVYLLYTELLIGAVRVFLFGIFVMIMMKVHTFPLFAIRPMYLTVRAFRKALNDVIQSRRAIHNMNTLYPDATPEELAQGDNVCIICREEMTENCKKLPCNHIFHRTCLRSWFQRQQTCPTCRMEILRPLVRPAAAGLPAAAQPQQPQQPNPFFPPGIAPGMPGFPMWMPPHPPAPAARPPASSGAGSSVPPAPGASGAGAQASTAPGVPPAAPPLFMPPPMPGMFPPMGGMMPPFGAPGMFGGFPQMPANLQNLSPEELATMEGQERQSVANRIECLQNIRMLLDAGFMQIQQYYSLIQADSSSRPIVTNVVPTPATTAATNWRPQPSHETTTVTSSTHTVPSPKEETTPGAVGGSAPNLPSGQTLSETASAREGGSLESSSADMLPEFNLGGDEPMEGADLSEVRRRRIEKLSSTNLPELEREESENKQRTDEGRKE